MFTTSRHDCRGDMVGEEVKELVISWKYLEWLKKNFIKTVSASQNLKRVPGELTVDILHYTN
jgi:hypothetical protein